ncbi:hypothetical protein CAPTEDRAFT_164839 [Capitella teleta]|uniref:Annexin n=1 Tax=Capitella teleta TaxID=283909 RepID=R7V603_CAPTE|nr:hypothetical protein CAPTEDRAFT_164839 [Capitella teleta]|eukprot:ELU14293.1 hypothetical protein CAPTEDRAFT_164839 [Capitella teleta]
MATVFENPDFNAEELAEQLKNAMRGLGTDEAEIVEVVGKITNAERQEVAANYKTSYGEDLIDALKSELGGDFEDAVVALMTPPRLFDANQLRDAMKGAGTDEATLVEILCSRSNEEIEEIKALFESEFERNLEEDIMNETSGYFKRLLVSQVNAGRDQSDDVDEDLANEEAQEIYDAGEGSWGTDEAAINKILSLRNYAQLRATFDAYGNLAERDIEEAIDSECSGCLQEGLLAIVRYAKDPPTFFARRLYDSMKGAGTSDNDLIRVITSRSEVDLADIKEAFQNKYEQSLNDFVADDVGGDYKRLLLAVIGDA